MTQPDLAEATRTAAALVIAFVQGDEAGMFALVDANEASSVVAVVLASWIAASAPDKAELEAAMRAAFPESP